MGYLLKHSLSLDDQRNAGRGIHRVASELHSGKPALNLVPVNLCKLLHYQKAHFIHLKDLIILQPSNTLNGAHVLVHRDLSVEEIICTNQEMG